MPCGALRPYVSCPRHAVQSLRLEINLMDDLKTSRLWQASAPATFEYGLCLGKLARGDSYRHDHVGSLRHRDICVRPPFAVDYVSQGGT